MTVELIEAIEAGDEQRARAALAEHPEQASERDANGVRALLLALYNGVPIVDDIRARRGELDVFEAAAVGDTARIEELLRADEGLANATTPDGFTALHYAAFFGTPEAARLLLERGADPNVLATHPQLKVFPIHSAAASRQTETVRMLLEHGADPNARQEGGFTALHSAAVHGDRELAELLLANGAEASITTDEGRTPADIAAEKGHEELATLLRR